MVERQSPLGSARRPGAYGNLAEGPGVSLSEIRLGSIVECAAWPGQEKALIAAISGAIGLALPDGAGAGASDGPRAAFAFAPGKFLAVDEGEDLAATLRQAISSEIGTITDLSHGRTAIRISGRRTEWVLAKFFAIDFSLPAFPVGSGRATQHHEIFAQIRRANQQSFDLYVFRSFARAFWTALCRGAAEVGYEVL